MHTIIDRPIVHEGNAVIPMSTNMVYHGNTSQDNILLHQSNPAYIKASDIHIYDEIPAGQYEEFVSVKKTNLHNDDDDDDQEDQEIGSYVSQGNQEDQDNEDNEGYIDTGVIDDVAQSQEDKGSYENISKVDYI